MRDHRPEEGHQKPLPKRADDGGGIDPATLADEKPQERGEEQKLRDEIDRQQDGPERGVPLYQAGEAKEPVGARGDEINQQPREEQRFPREKQRGDAPSDQRDEDEIRDPCDGEKTQVVFRIPSFPKEISKNRRETSTKIKGST